MSEFGSLYVDFLKVRRQVFVEDKGWGLPVVDGMEFDQYDTPASRWVTVHEDGHVMAGVRLTPTTHRCGIYTYMIRDAQRGLLETIPADLLDRKAPIASHIWESSRVFVSREVPANLRFRVQMQLISEMVSSARALGASELIGIIPANSPRLARRVGLDCVPAGRELDFDGEKSVAVSISMATKMH